MDRISRQIINAIKSSDDNSYMFYSGILPFEDIGSPTAINSALKYLVDNGYLNEITGDGQVIGVSLSHKSLHPGYFTWLNVKHFLFYNLIAIIALIIAFIGLLNDLGLITIPPVK